MVLSYNVYYDPVHDMTSDAHYAHRLRLLSVCKTILFVVLLSMIFNKNGLAYYVMYVGHTPMLRCFIHLVSLKTE